MSDELVAIVILIGWSVVSFILSLFVFRWIYERESKKLLAQFDIEGIKGQFEGIVHENMQSAIDTFSESFNELLGNPTISKAFSIIGKKGGEVKAENAVVDEMATNILDSPKFSAIRLAAEAMGLDIDGYIEKHGALKTISAARQLASITGIDIMNLDMSSLALPASGSGGGKNPYLRR